MFENVKQDLLNTINYIGQANSAVDDITIKKLTRGNPTAAALREDARNTGAQQVGEEAGE